MDTVLLRIKGSPFPTLANLNTFWAPSGTMPYTCYAPSTCPHSIFPLPAGEQRKYSRVFALFTGVGQTTRTATLYFPVFPSTNTCAFWVHFGPSIFQKTKKGTFFVPSRQNAGDSPQTISNLPLNSVCRTHLPIKALLDARKWTKKPKTM
jgi:hypothetical protein